MPLSSYIPNIKCFEKYVAFFWSWVLTPTLAATEQWLNWFGCFCQIYQDHQNHQLHNL